MMADTNGVAHQQQPSLLHSLLARASDGDGDRDLSRAIARTAASLLPYDQTFWTSAETALLDEQREHAVRETATAVERLRADGVAAEGMVVVEPDAARAILHVAAEQRADAVAMSTHARAGAARLLLGSVTDKVIRASDLPVLVVRP